MTSQLPVDEVLAEIRTRLNNHRRLLLQSPPGSGKTTHVPLALLSEDWLSNQRIIMLEPRRLAAKAAARRMAQLVGEEVGQTVGYRVRFDTCVSDKTRIEVVTEGILTRRLQSDPMLEGVGLVIFDEFHERNLHSDLAFALCMDVWKGLRDDLRIVVMSATLDTELLKRRFGPNDLVTASGRTYPVDIHYLGDVPEGRLIDQVVKAVSDSIVQDMGDMLLFLPGVGEIKRVMARLSEMPSFQAIELLPLYGDLTRTEQDKIFVPSPARKRRVIVSTPIAESSLTIEGVSIVIDSGLAREPRYSPRSGLTELRTVRISKASSEQRAGRAGRMAPGVCYRLWGEGVQRGLLAHGVPEIEQADLSSLALDLSAWGVSDLDQLPWVTAPPAGAITQAREQLQQLGAIDDRYQLTAHGRAMVELPLHPRLAHMLIWANSNGLGSIACDVAALLSERDILAALRRDIGCDLSPRYDLLQTFRRHGRKGVRAKGGGADGCARVDRAAKQWRRLLKSDAGQAHQDGEPPLGLIIAQAYPERIAQRRGNGDGRYRLASGQGVAMWADDSLSSADFIAVAHADVGQGEGRVYLCSEFSLVDLRNFFSEQIKTSASVYWDSHREAVVAETVETYHALRLKSDPLANPQPTDVVDALLKGIAQMGLGVLPWNDAARQWQARVLLLRQNFPEEEWPNVCDQYLLENMHDWLAPYLLGITKKAQFSRLNMVEMLSSLLPWERQQLLNQLAPVNIKVPSGQNRALRYELDAPPVLAVKLQEMFGQAQTPTIANGRIPVLIHLLSPARRPLQVTQDLASFWANGYQEVKKEMKGRYPKHPWPDDPLSSIPTRKLKNSNRR